MAKKVVPGSITKAYIKREGDFSPDLVGFQFTKSSSLFTLGNFSLTTNASSLTDEIFNTGEFSDPITLTTLNLTLTESENIGVADSNNLSVLLKNDKQNFLSYVYFGNATKFLETEITDIITKWTGSLYLRKSNINDTVIGYSYNTNKDTTTFSIPTNVMTNTFNLVTDNSVITSGDDGDISVLRESHTKYEISNDNGSFKILSYTGNSLTNDYIRVIVAGDAWSNITGGTSGSFTYHLKPTNETQDKYFFSKLSDFQNQIMNRLTTPKYTFIVDVPYQNDLGYTIKTTSKFTWPTTDGYNIDIDGRNYREYLNDVFGLIRGLDSDKTNIMVRRLVASAILDFDSVGDGTDVTGRKMDKLLKIWGREYDEIKKYIDGISFANVVTYDGKDNTPDELVKIFAANLGFDTIQSFSDNNLINYLVTTTNTVFSGNSRSLSIQELDTELWRRLVINAWWLFRSKGTRKVIEFFLNLFQIDECLVDLNECVYLVESKLDFVDTLIKLDDYYGIGGYSIDDMPIDDDGYPKVLSDTPEYYFQMDGFWYDGGVPENTKPDTNGNNPHYGPYDFGRQYFDKFRCFIGDFTPVSNTLLLNELTFNYFTDYSLGTVEGTGETIVEGDNNSSTTTTTGNILTAYDQFYGGTMNNNDRVTTGTTILLAGSTDEQSNNGTSSFKITFSTGDEEDCKYCPNQIMLTNNGLISYELDQEVLTIESTECCTFFGYDMFLDNNDSTNKCYWCAPNEYFQEVFISTEIELPTDQSSSKGLPQPGVTIIQFTNPEGNLESPSRDCCIMRGYTWDGVNGRCLPSEPTPTTPNEIKCTGLQSLTIDGYVLSDGFPMSEYCCDKLNYATWTKGGCKIN